MERVNCSEREIAKMFQIPINSLKRCRSEKRFGTDICFTAPYSHKILYDIKNFKKQSGFFACVMYRMEKSLFI